MEKALKNYVIGILRSASVRWEGKAECAKRARVERGLYKCAMCEGSFRRKDIQIDHIESVINPRTGFTNFDDYIERLFVPPEKLQSLCFSCHEIKSELENELRKHYRKVESDEKKAKIKAEKLEAKRLKKEAKGNKPT